MPNLGNNISDSLTRMINIWVGFGSPQGCKIVAGGRRPPESEAIDPQHPERVRDIIDSVGARAGTPSGCNLIHLPLFFAATKKGETSLSLPKLAIANARASDTMAAVLESRRSETSLVLLWLR